MKKITVREICKAVNGEWIGEDELLEIFIQKITIDSRTVIEECLYIPIIGERFDGHDFIEQAFEKGATIVFSNRKINVPVGKGALIVSDTKLALGALAKYYRSKFTLPIIAITGSVGKTSTREMLSSILSRKYRVHQTQKNYNNDIGVPLTLLGLEDTHEIAILELGMNHFGEIDYLASLVLPTYGVITNIGVAHIEYLGSKEGILKAKTEMLPYIDKKGMLLINGDDKLLFTINKIKNINIKTYGKKSINDCNVLSHKVTQVGQQMVASTKSNTYEVEVPYFGEVLLFNGLSGILLGEELGLTKEKIIEGIKAYRPAKMRLELIQVSNDLRLIDDCYNASVTSMESGLKTLTTINKKEERTVAILGSMLEMGSYAKEGHLEVGRLVAKYKPNQLIVVGEYGLFIKEGAIQSGYNEKNSFYYENQEELLENLNKHIREKDLVLLKASRGVALEKSRDYIIRKFGVNHE